VESFVTILIPGEFNPFLQQFCHGLGYSGKIWNETTVIASKTEKTADLMDRSRGFPIHHFLAYSDRQIYHP
jgi:hypothetical protein